tara:strand:+ start:858 stop:2714 length:1857 start_codon:yes stop_codon:yes gene_type:complete
LEPILGPSEDEQQQKFSPQGNSIPFGDAVGNLVSETANTGVTGSLIHHIWGSSFAPATKQNFVPNSEIPDYLKARYPHGTSSPELHYYVGLHDDEAHHEFMMSSAPNGFLDKAGYLGSGIIAGIVTDPIVDVATAGTGAATEAGVNALKTGVLLSKVSRAVTRGVAGSLEGAGIQTAQNISSYEYNKEIGMNPDLNLTDGLGMASIFGGAIHSVAGHISDIAHDSRLNANLAATSQMSGGDYADGSSILQNALHTSLDKTMGEVSAYGGKGPYVTSPKTKRSYPWGEDLDLNTTPQMDSIKFDSVDQDTLMGYHSVLENEISKVSKKISDLPEDYPSKDATIPMLNRAKDILVKLPLERTNSERSYLKNIQKMPHINTMLDALSENPVGISKSSKDIINSLHEDPNFERTMIDNNIEENKKSIDEISKQFKKSNIEEDGKEKANIIHSDINLTRKAALSSMLKARNKFSDEIDNLNNRSKVLSKSKQAGKKLTQMTLKKNNLENMRDSIFAQQKLHDIKPMTAQHPNAVYWAGKRGHRSIGVNEGRGGLANDIIRDSEVPSNDEGYQRDRLKDMVDQGSVDPKSISEVESDNKKLDDNNSRFKKAIDDTIKCIFGDRS